MLICAASVSLHGARSTSLPGVFPLQHTHFRPMLDYNKDAKWPLLQPLLVPLLLEFRRQRQHNSSFNDQPCWCGFRLKLCRICEFRGRPFHLGPCGRIIWGGAVIPVRLREGWFLSQSKVRDIWPHDETLERWLAKEEL
ncbi:hypothetical protein K439DRAFT_697219 [Ramaria rubella]|nr:hypothetical protein K439DRAFT_697219 [Ramaria rubella]